MFPAARSASARGLQLPQPASQRLNFLFVCVLLAFRQFDQLQGFLHLVEDAPQRFNDFGNLLNRLTKGRRRFGFRFRFARGLARPGGRGLGQRRRRRRL